MPCRMGRVTDGHVHEMAWPLPMLTGLLPASEGHASLFGRPVDAHDLETRKRVGYMSQSFSLYGELTVRQNLDRLKGRIQE